MGVRHKHEFGDWSPVAELSPASARPRGNVKLQCKFYAVFIGFILSFVNRLN
jgi:hypothetical protein